MLCRQPAVSGFTASVAKPRKLLLPIVPVFLQQKDTSLQHRYQRSSEITESITRRSTVIRDDAGWRWYGLQAPKDNFD